MIVAVIAAMELLAHLGMVRVVRASCRRVDHPDDGLIIPGAFARSQFRHYWSGVTTIVMGDGADLPAGGPEYFRLRSHVALTSPMAIWGTLPFVR
jgi:hypothetical protein